MWSNRPKPGLGSFQPILLWPAQKPLIPRSHSLFVQVGRDVWRDWQALAEGQVTSASTLWSKMHIVCLGVSRVGELMGLRHLLHSTH